MSFLSPWSAVLAAAVAVPLLLLLYFLKLRRRSMRIASTMLWPRSAEDLQANVPFQRLRWSLLMLLQLLVVATLLAALARPVVQTGRSPWARVILLIDRSASMNARDAAGRSRLDAAKAAAEQLVQRLGRRREPGELMVVAFGSSPQVYSGFESNRQILLDAIDSIGPTDEQANLDAALALAGAFASRDETVDQPPPEVVLISDGGVGDPIQASGFSLQAGDLRFIGVGPEPDEAVDNVGIATFSARRDYQDPGKVLVFARLVNAGPQPIDTTFTLRLDGQPVGVKSVRVPAASDRGLGETSITYTLDLSGPAVLTLSGNHPDDLPGDDTAALVLRPPAAPRIALVHPGDDPDPFLHGLVEALRPQRLVVLSSQPSNGDDEALRWSSDEFDLVIFDRVSPHRWPSVATLSFGAAPAGIGRSPPSDPGGRRILSWDRRHPVMRHVSLDPLVYADFGGYDLPQDGTPLAWGPDGAVIAVVRRRGVRHVLVGFTLQQSNWPMHVSITVFMQNVLDYLTLGGEGLDSVGLAAQPGRPITVRRLPEARQLSIEGPINVTVEVDAEPEVTLPNLRRVGLYRVRGAAPPMDRIAVNMSSDIESDIRPRRSLVVNAQVTQASTPSTVAPLELWPWLVAIAIGLLVIEWIVYCKRIRG
ncbi:MAG: VWA domain-containing protein [Planctomycetota bacterium]|nr:VWA domain-containing protein [Planctomycetota bacterium]